MSIASSEVREELRGSGPVFHYERRATLKRPSYGPVQPDGSVLVATYDGHADETHDTVVDQEGRIVSENIWGGRRYYTAERGYIECIAEETHCLILDPVLHRVYVHNDLVSFFHWEMVELEVWG